MLGSTFRHEMAVCQTLVPLVNIKIAGKWMFIPLKMVLIGIDPYPNGSTEISDFAGAFFSSAAMESPWSSLHRQSARPGSNWLWRMFLLLNIDYVPLPKKDTNQFFYTSTHRDAHTHTH